MITHPINKRLCDENFDNISAVDKGICLSQDDEGIWKYAQKLWEKRDRSDFDYGARLLTQLYFSTLNKEQDQPLAWFLWTASEGDVFSQVGVGKLYFEGEFVKQDYSQATYWFEKAAKQGDVEAMLYMGWLSINASTEKGYLAALKWYYLAAKKESSTAIIELSNLYLAPPQGQEKDIAKGLQWLQLGTHRGDPIAKHRLADAYFNSEYNMQHKQAEAMQMYEELFNEENDLKAAYHLGNCHLYGTAQLGPDYKESVKWFTKAAEKEHFPAKLRLAYLLDVLRVHSEAAKWRETVIYTDLSTVSEQQVVDITELQYRQGMYYYDQKTSEESIEKAIRIFSLAAGTGEPRSLAQLGLLYFKGVLVPKDIEKAHDWLSKWEATRKKFNKTERAKGDKSEQLKYENEEAEKALKELSFLDLASELT